MEHSKGLCDGQCHAMMMFCHRAGKKGDCEAHAIHTPCTQHCGLKIPNAIPTLCVARARTIVMDLDEILEFSMHPHFK